MPTSLPGKMIATAALWLVVASPALAADADGTGLWPTLYGFLTGSVFVGAVGWVVTKGYDMFSARRSAELDFVKGTTAQVVTLASTHYWALANAAGTAGDLLGQHLRTVQAHLALRYGGPGVSDVAAAQGLRDTMARICDESANSSFPSVVRLIVLFDRFQFRGSQTYLLPSHAAGMALRRLYNQFAGSLPDDFVTPVRVAVETHLRTEAKTAGGEPGVGIGGTFLETKSLKLDPVLDLYRTWLQHHLVQVSDAADALRAFGELLTHELANLNRAFFNDHRKIEGTAAFGARMLEEATWPATLAEASLLALVRADAQSEFYRPLGGVSAQAARIVEATTAVPESRVDAPSMPATGPGPEVSTVPYQPPAPDPSRGAAQELVQGAPKRAGL